MSGTPVSGMKNIVRRVDWWIGGLVSACRPHIGESHQAKSCIALKVSVTLGVSLTARLGHSQGSPPSIDRISFNTSGKEG